MNEDQINDELALASCQKKSQRPPFSACSVTPSPLQPLPVTSNRHSDPSVYNKLFTKILDSSIWLEDMPTRVVWMTLLAAQDEDGFCQFASVANLAHRARVSPEEGRAACACLESPDENSSDPDNEGRRIERVSGGWIVLNGPKYRDLVTREAAKEKTRVRVARFRAKRDGGGNGEVTQGNDSVTPSEAVSEKHTEAEAETPPQAGRLSHKLSGFDEFWEAYPRKVGKGDAEKAWVKLNLAARVAEILSTIRTAKASFDWTKEAGQFIPHPATWLHRKGWDDQFAPAKPGTGPDGYKPPSDGHFLTS